MRPPLRSAVWASALAVGVFEVVGTFGASDNQPERKAVDALAILLVLIGPAALALRDRLPRLAVVAAMASATTYIALSYPYGPIFVSVVVALYSAVQAGHRRDAGLLAAAGYVGFVIADTLDARGDNGWLHWALVAGWLCVVLAVSEVVRARREQMVVRLRSAHEERQRRQGEQRLVLAQELHDVLAHNISLVNVQASVALHLLDEQPERARPALTAIKDASHEALRELRAALDLLRDGDDAAAPRVPAPRLTELDSLVDGVRATGLDVHVERPDQMDALSPALELAIYRIVQEALTNVTRHARANLATVRIGHDHQGLRVEIADDGVGGVAEAGNGLVGMRERARALGGTVEIGPGPTGGFRVVAHLPLDPA